MNTAVNQPITLSAAALPKVGDRMPGGVVGALVLADGERPAYLLIVSDAEHEAKLAFGGYRKDMAGTSDWDGKANTELLLQSGIEHPAAAHCANLVVDGCNDFFLMSRRDASALCASSPHLFNQDDWTWTSTQRSANKASIQYFRDGLQDGSYKDFKFRVRPVRRHIIN